MLPATLEFGFRIGGAARRRTVDGPARLLVLADFSARPQPDSAALATRPTHRVDLDNLDAVMRRMAPTLAWSPAGYPPVALRFDALEAFHADALTAVDPVLQELLAQRRRLLDPSQFAAAARELGAPAPVAPTPTLPDAAEDDRVLVGRLLGQAPTPTERTPGEIPTASSASASPERAVDALIRQALSAQDLAPELPYQAQYLATVDAAASVALRNVLHHPPLQALEAVWRGVDLLVSELELGEELELHLLDVSRGELEQGSAELAQRFATLAESARDAGARWVMAGLLMQAEDTVEDLALLERLGQAASQMEAPIVVGASLDLAGLAAAPGEWQPLPAESQARWQRLRHSPAADWLGLAAPRLLLRLPYGPRRDAIDSFDFDELAGAAPQADELLWVDASLACLLYQGRIQTGSEAGAARDLADLPALITDLDGERVLHPAAERLLGDRAAAQTLAHGVMPIQGSRHRNAVRLLAWQPVATE